MNFISKKIKYNPESIKVNLILISKEIEKNCRKYVNKFKIIIIER